MPENPLLQESVPTLLLQETVQAFLTQCREKPFQLVSVRNREAVPSPEIKEALEKSWQMLESYLQGCDSLENAAQFQIQIACATLLSDWKHQRLPQQEQQFLDLILMQHWRSLLDRLQRGFDPITRLAHLEQEVQRLMESQLGLVLGAGQPEFLEEELGNAAASLPSKEVRDLVFLGPGSHPVSAKAPRQVEQDLSVVLAAVDSSVGVADIASVVSCGNALSS